MLPERVIVIGLDGVGLRFLTPFLEAGLMPNLDQIRREGCWGSLESVVPTNSMSAWTSFMTGQLPAKHGVFDFRSRSVSDWSRLHVTNARWVRTPTLDGILSSQGRTVGTFNVPVTYPAREVDGFVVAGMLTPSVSSSGFTYPAALRDDLLSQVNGYVIDTAWQYYQHRVPELLDALTSMMRQRAEAFLYLLRTYRPKFMVGVFVGTDRLQHCLWRYLFPAEELHAAEEQEYKQRIQEYMAELDVILGQILEEAGEKAAVFIMSDHGFQTARWQFLVDPWLQQKNWLSYKQRSEGLRRFLKRIDIPIIRKFRRRLVSNISGRVSALSPTGTIDWGKTAAYCGYDQQQSIFINLKGREPAGIVTPGAYEALRSQIIQALLALREPTTQTPVVARVWKREEYYGDSYVETTPDIVFALTEGFASSPAGSGLFADLGWASADHSLGGILFALGPGIRRGECVQAARLIDLAPTILHLMGCKVPVAMDGRVLEELVTSAFLSSHPVVLETEQIDSEWQRDRDVLSSEDVGLVEQRLRGLGYLD